MNKSTAIKVLLIIFDIIASNLAFGIALWLRFDGRMFRAFAIISSSPVGRRAILTTIPEDIRPSDAQLCSLPGRLAQRDPAVPDFPDLLHDCL